MKTLCFPCQRRLAPWRPRARRDHPGGCTSFGAPPDARTSSLTSDTQMGGVMLRHFGAHGRVADRTIFRSPLHAIAPLPKAGTLRPLVLTVERDGTRSATFDHEADARRRGFDRIELRLPRGHRAKDLHSLDKMLPKRLDLQIPRIQFDKQDLTSVSAPKHPVGRQTLPIRDLSSSPRSLVPGYPQ